MEASDSHGRAAQSDTIIHVFESAQSRWDRADIHNAAKNTRARAKVIAKGGPPKDLMERLVIQKLIKLLADDAGICKPHRTHQRRSHTHA